jgi:lysophospholipase L1-like esterase
LERGKSGLIGVLFLGDSTTDFWRRDNVEEIWANFNRYASANFGISGDKTQHVLWRIENGELNNIKPKVVLIMIGTNNLKLNTKQKSLRPTLKSCPKSTAVCPQFSRNGLCLFSIRT